MPDDFRVPWWLNLIPALRPHDTPSIRDQVKCPEGMHRDLGSGQCVPNPPAPPGRLVEVQPDDAFVMPGPVPGRPPLPPKVPQPTPPPAAPPPSTPGPSPADVARPSTQTRIPGMRAGAYTLTTVGLLLAVLGQLVFLPYFRPPTGRIGPLGFPMPAPTGPPRRRGRVTTPTVPAPRPWPDAPFYEPLPRFPATGLPIPLPRRTPSVPRSVPSTSVPVGLPGPRPRPVPRTRPSMPSMPAPEGWTLGDPLPGIGYDPYTYAPPSPRPRVAPTTPGRSTRRVRFPLPFSPFGLPGSVGRPVFDRPLTPQQPRPSSPSPRVRLPPAPFDPLTPLQDPVPTSQPQALRKPTSANPCTTERTARRRRQRDCKRYTTKTIRVCADK